MEKVQQQRRKEEEDPSTNGDRKKQETLACQECKQKPSKYKCPGCSLRTCSITCFEAHKLRISCTGKKKQAHFVLLSQYDCNVLEKSKRIAESAKMKRTNLGEYPSYRLRQDLKRAAANRRIKLHLLPSGMLRREMNQTQYDKKRKFISWTIEWQFHSTDVVLRDHGMAGMPYRRKTFRVHKDTKICSVLEKHLKPGQCNHQLWQFCEEHLGSLKLFIRKHNQGQSSPFCQLDINASLKQQLVDGDITEYPVIHVSLLSHSYDFGVIKDRYLVAFKQNASVTLSNDHHIPKGIMFREEELEDGADNVSSDPQVYDFTKNEVAGRLHQLPNNNPSERALDHSCDGSFVARETAVNVPHSSSESEKPVVFENMDFDNFLDLDGGFDPDDFLDLDGGFDPDDFLDLDGGFCEEEDRIIFLVPGEFSQWKRIRKGGKLQNS